MNVLDGSMCPENVIFIMTTNYPEKLDKALIRPGRIDMNIELKKCSRYQLAQIYKDIYSKMLPEPYLNRFREDTYITAEIILHLFYNKLNAKLSVEDFTSTLSCAMHSY